MKVTESLCSIGSVTTWPVAMCSAAMMEAVPLRTYSNSRRARPRRPRRPGRGGRSGYLRDLAWIPVFSSMQITTVPGGGRR